MGRIEKEGERIVPINKDKSTPCSLWYQLEDGRYLEAPRECTLVIDETKLEGVITETPIPMEMTFIWKAPKSMAILLFQKVMMMPNNWLKMHGYPKRRRAKE